MTWTELALYALAGWFALAGLYCLLRFFRERNWLSDDNTRDWLSDAADEQVRARQVWREDRRSLSEPAAKSAEAFKGRVVQSVPPTDGRGAA